MLTLTDEEIELWLDERGLRKAPYESPHSGFEGFYQQVRIPSGSPQRWAFASCIVKACGTLQEAALHFTDWAHYTPDQMAIVSAVLAAHGESRPLIEVPAQAFEGAEAELLTGMLGLAMTFGWSAYFYVKDGPSFLAWEGEILDMWVPLDQEQEVRLWIDRFLRTGE